MVDDMALNSWVACFLVCRGKGDYHRLGHGSDDHVRRPRQVQGLQGKKVTAIATGSLHCVCCTEDGRWGAFSPSSLIRVMGELGADTLHPGRVCGQQGSDPVIFSPWC